MRRWLILKDNTNFSTEAHLPTPQYGQYLTHAHNHITPALADMDSCFVQIRAHQHGIAPGEIYVSLPIIDPAVLWVLIRTKQLSMSHLGKEEKNCELATIPDFRDAFLWEDPDQDQWCEITRIMVDQMSRWILVQSGFIGSFDLLWSIRVISDHWSWSGSSQRNSP